MEKESSEQRPVEANSRGGQGSRRVVTPSDDDDDDDDIMMMSQLHGGLQIRRDSWDYLYEGVVLRCCTKGLTNPQRKNRHFAKCALDLGVEWWITAINLRSPRKVVNVLWSKVGISLSRRTATQSSRHHAWFAWLRSGADGRSRLRFH
jgi:hypothetical protein